MPLPKTIELLTTFSGEDWRACGNYLQGEYREGNEMIALYKSLKQQKHRLSRPVFDVEEIRSEHFQSITRKSFYNLLSKLYGKIEEYFIHHSLQKDEIKSQLTLLKALSDRGLYKEFDKKAEELEKILLDENRVDMYDELHLMQLNHMRFFSNNPIKNHRGSQLLYDIEHYSKKHQRQYLQLIEATKIHFQQITKEKTLKIYNQDTNVNKQEIMSLIHEIKKSPSLSTFQKLRGSVTSPILKVSKGLKNIILEILIHDAHQRIKTGDMSLITDLLALYEYGFDNGLLLSNQTITENKLINVIVIACAGEQFEKAQYLLSKYSELLLKKTKVKTIIIAKATIMFYKGDYETLLSLIKDESFFTTSQQIRRRWMMICASFKLMGSDINYILGQIKNYNSFLYNNKTKLSSASYNGSLNLSRAINIMTHSRSSEELFNFIESCEHLIFKSWLLKEAGALTAPASSKN